MLTYLEAIRFKITTSLNELDSRPPIQHPLATHIQIVRDKQGLQQSILKVILEPVSSVPETVSDSYKVFKIQSEKFLMYK